MVEFHYGTVTTQVLAAPEYLRLIKSLLTVINPDGDPPTISFWNDDSQTLLSGHLSYIQQFLSREGIPFQVTGAPPQYVYENPRSDLIATTSQPGFRLHRYQCATARKMLSGIRGGVQLATGAGKTACYITSLVWLERLYRRPVNSLTVVPTTNLADQMTERMVKAGLNAQVYKRGSWGDASHVVSVINGLHKKMMSGEDKLTQMLNSRDVLCFDEGHHTQADTFFTLGLRCPAPFRWNLSATLYANRINPYQHPGDMRIIGVTGPTLAVIPARFLWENGFVPKPEITFIPVDYPNYHHQYGFYAGGRWHDTAVWRGTGKKAAQTGVEWDLVVNSGWRNEIARRLCFWSLYHNPAAKIVILVQRKDHGELLQRALHVVGIPSVCCYGGSKVVTIDRWGKQKRWTDRKDTMLDAFQRGDQRVLIGSQKFDEGQSFPEFDHLLLVQAGKGGEANRRVYQRVGRSMHAQRKVYVWELYDRTHRMVQRQAEDRLLALHNEGYPVQVDTPWHLLHEIPGISDFPCQP